MFSLFKLNKIEVHKVNDQARDSNILRQIFSSVSFKALSIIIGFLMVPLLLKKLGQEKYGIWALLLSTVQWVSLMDIGIGNGLRIKLTEALSANRQKEAKEYVSTAYFLMASIAVTLVVLLLPVFFLFEWNHFFNTEVISEAESRWVVMIFVISMVLFFVLSLLNQVMYSVQRSSLTSIAPLMTSLFFIFIIYFFFPDASSNLLGTSLVYTLCLIFMISFVSIVFYNEYRNLSPQIKFFNKARIRELLSLGIKFFVIQIIGIVIFSTDNIIITQLLGPKYVSIYNVPFLIFNNIGMLVNMVLVPMYSSYTEAYTKGDLKWIRSKVSLLCKLMIPFVFFIGIVICFFPLLKRVWLGDAIEVSQTLTLLIGIYTVISVWNNIFSYVLGGIGKINLGMYSTVVQGVLNIPLAIYFGKYLDMGLNGIILSNIICLSISSLLSPIQVYYFIFSQKQTKLLTRILS